jgi:hypothetical protein
MVHYFTIRSAHVVIAPNAVHLVLLRRAETEWGQFDSVVEAEAELARAEAANAAAADAAHAAAVAVSVRDAALVAERSRGKWSATGATGGMKRRRRDFVGADSRRGHPHPSARSPRVGMTAAESHAE